MLIAENVMRITALKINQTHTNKNLLA